MAEPRHSAMLHRLPAVLLGTQQAEMGPQAAEVVTAKKAATGTTVEEAAAETMLSAATAVPMAAAVAAEKANPAGPGKTVLIPAALLLMLQAAVPG